MTHHSHLAVCHGWLNLPLGGCHGYDGGDFGCAAEVWLLHLTAKWENMRYRPLWCHSSEFPLSPTSILVLISEIYNVLVHSYNFQFSQMIMQHGREYNTEVLTQSVLAGAGLAVRLCGSVHHAGLLVIAAASGASAAVSSHSFTDVCVGQLSLTLQQGVWVTVWVPQHWIWHRKLVLQLHLIFFHFYSFALVITQRLPY